MIDGKPQKVSRLRRLRGHDLWRHPVNSSLFYFFFHKVTFNPP
jgi:hypothetical protein